MTGGNKKVKRAPDKIVGSTPGIIVFICATVVIFIVMLAAMFKSGMLPAPAFLSELFGGETPGGGDAFMSDFMSGVSGESGESGEVEYERVVIGKDELDALIAGVDTPAGMRSYTVTVSYNGMETVSRSSVFIGESMWTVDVSKRTEAGIFAPYKRVSASATAVDTVENVVSDAPVNRTTAHSFSSSGAFYPQTAAGITRVSELLDAIENGADIGYRAELLRSDSASVKNVLALTFEHNDGISDYIEIDVETGDLIREISVLDGVPYYQALLNE